MKTMLALFLRRRMQACVWIATCILAASAFGAQAPATRIHSEISLNQTAQVKNTHHLLAQAQFDTGRMDQNAKINGISILFKRSAQQQADLEALLAAQQNPASPSYHQWLSPEQFAARFGMAQADLDKVQSWLEQQGFTVDSIARSKNLMRFSGTVRQVEQAFSAEIHNYSIRGERHFSPATDLSVPAVIAPVVESIQNLSDFRPHAMHTTPRMSPSFTSGQTGSVFFSPGDIRLAYDINPLLQAGSDGTGQSIVAVGQSSIVVADIENFQRAAGLPVKDPTMVLVPGTGAAAIATGDESESDLDLEWSGAIAPGANIYFVYTGNSANYSVLDAVRFAVNEKIGNIISVSYGVCESLAGNQTIEPTLQQAAAQGQTVIVASGDEGSYGCYSENGSKSPAVEYPASSPWVTSVGGTEITTANGKGNTTYWNSQGSADVINSLKAYIPEVAWNDDTTSSLSASGGGASALYPKPSWQAGVPGIPNDSKRDVPDVAFYASSTNPGYLICSSDTSLSITGSCSHGFRDSSSANLTVIGGTSVAAPVFAGMMAIINQAKGYTTGQGLVNPSLYTLASNSATYASAFHDVTTGNNCPVGTSDASCTGSTGFHATTGYDQVTGLGSVDLTNLATAWAPSTAAPLATTTTSVFVSSTVAQGASTTVTVAVNGNAPTGTISVSIDGGAAQTYTLNGNGTAAFSVSFPISGIHSIIVRYGGDGANAPSTGSASVTVPAIGTFTVAAKNVTISRGSSGQTSITVTPASGYTGLVELQLTNSSNNTALTNLCYSVANPLVNGAGSANITGTSAVTATLLLDTNANDCLSASVQSGGTAYHKIGGVSTAAKNTRGGTAPLTIAFAGLLLAGFLCRSSRKLRSLSCLVALLSIGMAVTACGGSSSSSNNSTNNNPPKGTYTITIMGVDAYNSSITATNTFTLTIN